jgi:hypothetical protein
MVVYSDLPGCGRGGERRREAVRYLRDALYAWLHPDEPASPVASLFQVQQRFSTQRAVEPLSHYVVKAGDGLVLGKELRRVLGLHRHGTLHSAVLRIVL